LVFAFPIGKHFMKALFCQKFQSTYFSDKLWKKFDFGKRSWYIVRLNSMSQENTCLKQIIKII